MLKRKKLSQRELSSPDDPQTFNLFDGIPATLQEEFCQTLAASGEVRIERIVSDGHATPPGNWYDQKWDEWVLLISGEASLQFENPPDTQILRPGDHIMIPAGSRHRVERTAATQKTIWLTVHFAANTAK